MTIKDLIEQLRAQVAEKLAARNTLADQLAELRSAETTDDEKVSEVREAKDALDAEIDTLMERVRDLETEQARDEAIERLAAEVHPTGTTREGNQQVRVGAEPRTYSPENDKRGTSFLRDVGAAFLGDFSAQERLARHMAEERVERGAAVEGQIERAAGTGAFTGLVVPQYLTDLYAPAAKASRPFADVCNHHDLPASGMTVNLSRITTATTVAVQGSENSGVSETNIDDTLLTVNVQTIAGQQTLSRQAIERGTGVEDVMLDDLFRSYATTLDSTLLNQASTGLTNVATDIDYTDSTPTVAELYPKIIGALSGVEGALLDQDPADNVAVMHSRRWYWIQSSVTSTWPGFSQPNIPAQMMGTNAATAYGSGLRGYLPNGTPVVCDNNIATNLGGGTEDEIYVVSRRECHLWEDASAPMLIRAEQPAAASLGVLFVVYGYIAYTHTRYAHARKISDTGMAAPTF
jgi:HK97 family phage major capsid protein